MKFNGILRGLGFGGACLRAEGDVPAFAAERVVYRQGWRFLWAEYYGVHLRVRRSPERGSEPCAVIGPRARRACVIPDLSSRWCAAVEIDDESLRLLPPLDFFEPVSLP